MNRRSAVINWTWTDEAPALATLSFLPIIQAFMRGTGITIELSDISLAGRIIAAFPEFLEEKQRIPDHLAMLGELTLRPEANIIKLPNISSSVPQLIDAVRELQAQGYRLPDYPESPKNDVERAIRQRYDAVIGSAVNPVIREGNSDRRLPVSIKNFARKHPLSLGPWIADSKTHVAHMEEGDFYESERSVTIAAPTTVSYEFTDNRGAVSLLKKEMPLLAGDILDASVMSVRALRSFYRQQIEEARRQGLLLSLHVKATMMKVSDPVIFGHAVSVYYEAVFEKHAELFRDLGVNAENGVGDIYAKIQSLPPEKRKAVESDILAVYEKGPLIAMVDSAKGITNLHVPNNVIIDASMPAMIRDSGKMWGPDGTLHDTKALIPDRCYATAYKAIVEDCRRNGAFDPATMGSIPNVGLMAQQAEEYGSHDKTFIAPAAGAIEVRCERTGQMLLRQKVEKGDIFRSCRTTDESIRDWVRLAVKRTRLTATPAVFWLDPQRAHDAQVILKAERYLKEHDTRDFDIRIMEPAEAMLFSLDRIRKGRDTISVTGNVFRDYLTDLFPILEVGTSGKMLSIVPLLAGGGMFETGAGGSAPKHVQQFQKENYLRWDSLGEFSGLAASFDHLAVSFNNQSAAALAETLERAIERFLDNKRSPARRLGGIDNRGSHFYLALYWAQALAEQTKDKTLQSRFAGIARQLSENEAVINAELLAAQGRPVDMGGYYHFDIEKTSQAMRPSGTLNRLLDPD
ncbi:MAG TPA: NADP-dependent isocitrate dehydrogenase [Acidobacteriota bacterium]|nr:NADP-dependent isocitrate dehydrogenase [Acidobacteriota bacterium]